MSMEKEHHEVPHHGQSDHAEGGIPELEQVKAFWRDRGTYVTVVAAVIAVAVVGTKWVHSHKQRAVSDASAQLAAAGSAEDLEAIVSDYASTPSAPLALLKLAKASYDMGDYNGAMTHYQDFIDRYADYELASVGEVGLMHCREARGELEAAEAAFKAFAADHPDHFLAATAQMGQARCLEQLGRFDDARIVYEDMVAARADSLWADRATEKLETMDDRIEAYNNPPAASAPVMPELALPDSFGTSTNGFEPINIPAKENAE